MNGVTFDDMIDALLDELDRQWRKVSRMTALHPDRPHELCRLESLRATSCLMLATSAVKRQRAWPPNVSSNA